MPDVKVFILAAISITQESIKEILGGNESIKITGAADDLTYASKIICLDFPDVIIIDDSVFPQKELLDFVDNLPSSANSAKIIILTGSSNSKYYQTLIGLHVSGILFKKNVMSRLVDAVKYVSTGKVFFDENIRLLISRNKIIERFGTITNIEILSMREMEVLELILTGLENKAIADKLFISIKTVEKHKENLKKKLEIKTVKELYYLGANRRAQSFL